MPLYVINHKSSLSAQQQDAIASAITNLHTTTFSAPSLFVNVRFVPTSTFTAAYVGGKRASYDFIEAHVRTSPSRSRDMFNQLTAELAKKWTEIVPESPDVRIFLFGDIIGGLEHGFAIPEAGKDAEWMKENFGEFKKRAEGGDEQMRQMVEEIEARGLLQN